MRTYTVIDTITGETLTGTILDIEYGLPAWYPEAPEEVLGQVEELVDALRAEADLGDLCEALALTITSES